MKRISRGSNGGGADPTTPSNFVGVSMKGVRKSSSNFMANSTLSMSTGSLASIADMDTANNLNDSDIAPVVRTSKKSAELETISQLKTKKIGFTALNHGTLYGREKETAALRICLENLVGGSPNCADAKSVEQRQDSGEQEARQPQQQRHGRRALVLIKGYSGSGKTALVSTLKDPVMKQYRGLYVSGKFDLYLRDAQPYFGIAEACREICREILLLRGKFYVQIQEQLTKQLGPDIHLLTNLVPELAEIACEASDNASGGGNQEAQQAKARFHYVFRLFIRVVTTYYAPLVIVLDDLQWVDKGSLDLIRSLLTDADNPNFMVIGLYRSNEVEEHKSNDAHILTKWMVELTEIARSTSLDITEMHVGNLCLGDLKSIAMDLLSIDDDDATQELAELCHKRTQGNVFFLVRYMAMLEEEGFLNYDLNNGTYKWDIDRIRSETGAASNLVDLVNKKMANLPEDYGLLLSLAACLGSTFDLTKLEIVWPHFANESLALEDGTNSLEHRLSCAVEDGFLESLDQDSARYRWIHDNVQEAALMLIPESEQHDFKFRLGSTLCGQLSDKDLDESVRQNGRLSDEELDSSIFLVVNLLNEAPHTVLEDAQRIRVAKLNLRATQKAVSLSAFTSSARYASKGIELLPADSWSSNYWLTLDLYSTAVEAEDFTGNVVQMRTYGEIVLNQIECPLADKLRVYNVLASSITQSGNNVEACNLLVEVLGGLNVKFPKSGLGRLVVTLAGVVKTKVTINSRTSEEVAKMPIMVDPVQIERIKLLDKLVSSAYLSGSDLCALAIMKAAKLTLQKGLCEFSPPVFATLILIVIGALNDLAAGAKLGEYALLLLDKLGSRTPRSRTKFIVHGLGFGWTKPLQNSFAPLYETYQNGMACGDIESGMFGIIFYMVFSFMSGKPLKELEADCSNYAAQMKELGRQQAADFTKSLWQPAHNLMGLSESTTLIEGSVVENEKEFLVAYSENPSMLAIFRAQKLRLHAIFAEFEEGADIFKAYGYDFPDAAPAHPLFMATVFCGGVCCFAMAQTSKRGKFKKYAKKARSTVKSWVGQGNPNVKHCLALLDAENAALGKKYQAAEQNYQSAIAIAARGGFPNDAALANERYGEFMLSARSDKDGAKYYFEHAITYYLEWGATKKVELLRKKYIDLLS